MKFAGGKAHTASATLPWLLSTAGFAVLLGGIAGMQQSCGSGSVTGAPGVNTLGGVAAVNYLAPVSCDKFFSFDWFIVFFHFFVWFLVAVFLFSRKVHLARSMLTSMLAIASVLLMFSANTWYRAFSGSPVPLTGTFKTRARVAFAGAIISAVADLLLLMILGVHDERELDRGEEGYRRKEHIPTGTTATTTMGYREGPIQGAPVAAPAATV